MYDILHLVIEKAVKIGVPLHRAGFVTVLFLDKKTRLWQYIVEVKIL